MIKDVNSTHKGLGPLVATNILAAKAKKTVLNVSPAGCGKSVATRTVSNMMEGRSITFDSLTLAGMYRIQGDVTNFDGHIIVDDLGTEKGLWGRISTITVLSNLVYGHGVYKITHSYEIKVENFNGSVSLNIQPVLMHSLVQSDEWISVIRDKVLRYYHLYRPITPNQEPPDIDLKWGAPTNEVTMTGRGGKLWYQLVAIGLTQWSFARVEEHLADMLRATAALDGRDKVKSADYHLLIKLLRPIQLERYIVETYGFEQGRVFENNLYCVLVEIASFGEPTLNTICEDYKVSPTTARRLIETVPNWAFVKTNSPSRVAATDKARELLDICGVYDKW